MSHNDRKLWIENMNADRFSGKASWSHEQDFQEKEFVSMRQKEKWHVSESLYFALMAKKFLETPVKKNHLNNRSDLFVDELVSVFESNLDDTIEMTPKYTNILENIDWEVVAESAISSDFSREIPIEALYSIDADLRWLYKNHDIFASLRDYYMLDNGFEKDNFVITKIKEWEDSDNTPETIMCSPELWIYDNLPENEKIDATWSIINSWDHHKKIIYKISEHLGLDAYTSTWYVSELLIKYPLTKKTSIKNLLKELQKELYAVERNDWNVMLIASIIAIYTNNPVQFSRMSMYKIASARSIVEDIINDDHLDADIIQAKDRFKDWFKYINKWNFTTYILAIWLVTVATAMDEQDIKVNIKCKNVNLKLYKEFLIGNMKLIATDQSPHYETIEIMLDFEFDAMMDALTYFNEPDSQDTNESITDVKKHKLHSSRMLKNNKLPEAERQEIILEEALMQDSTFAYLQDPFLFSKKRLHFLSDNQLVELIENWYAWYWTFEHFIALMLYVCNATTVNDMYHRMMNYDYIIDWFYNTLSYINESISTRYIDFGFEHRIMTMISEYMPKILEHRTKNIKQAILESTLYDYEYNMIEQEILSYIAAFDQKLDAWDMKQQFFQLITSVMYEYEEQFSKDDDIEDLDDEDEDDDF